MTEPTEEPKPKEMRQLDADERKLMEKRMEGSKKELHGLLFAKHQSSLMLSEGIEAEANMNRKKYKKQLSAVNSEIDETKFAIEISEKQLREGVEEAPELEEKQVIVTIPNDQYDKVLESLGQFGCTVKRKEGEEQ